MGETITETDPVRRGKHVLAQEAQRLSNKVNSNRLTQRKV